MEKCFAKTANYAKGDGLLFDEYQKTYNLNSHCYQLSQSLCGAQQDIGCQGAMAAIMNIPTFLEFLNWLLSDTSADNNLICSLLKSLQSVEMIAQM